MCGRFSSTTQLSFLLEQLRAEPMGVEGHRPSWNVAPASDILVVIASSDGAGSSGPCAGAWCPSGPRTPTPRTG